MFPLSILLLALCSVIIMTAHTSEASPAPSEVFITTTASSTTKQRGRRRDARSRSMVSTATDAAMAINSVEFMDLLAGSKNTADVRTYTRSPMEQPHDMDRLAASDEGPSWGFASWLFRGGDDEAESDSSSHDITIKSVKELKHSSHETVTEYVGRLWFLPESKGGIRFRETMRVLSITHDGRSSTVECTTQYHNGSDWVDCSRVVCNFSSIPSSAAVENGTDGRRDNRADRGDRVKMSLDSELLVWLPLPRAASGAVGRKIASAFEAAALDFFEERASYY